MDVALDEEDADFRTEFRDGEETGILRASAGAAEGKRPGAFWLDEARDAQTHATEPLRIVSVRHVADVKAESALRVHHHASSFRYSVMVSPVSGSTRSNWVSSSFSWVSFSFFFPPVSAAPGRVAVFLRPSRLSFSSVV